MEKQGSGYGQYCPIARALDVPGERWSLLIVRDMIVGATRFNDLARGLPRLSRSLLTKRLRQLEFLGQTAVTRRMPAVLRLSPVAPFVTSKGSPKVSAGAG